MVDALVVAHELEQCQDSLQCRALIRDLDIRLQAINVERATLRGRRVAMELIKASQPWEDYQLWLNSVPLANDVKTQIQNAVEKQGVYYNGY